MYQRKLGKSGLEVSEIGLGCWQLGNDFGAIEENVALDILTTAYQQGVTFFDTADVYGAGLSEERIGQWRKTLDTPPIIATKVGRNPNLYPDGYTKAAVKESLANSAKRLGVEAIDLAQLHCVPRDVLFAGDIIAWMEDLQQEGLIKHFGASVEMLDEALFCCNSKALTSLQILFNVFRQDATTELFPAAEQNEVGIIVRLPLASGLLSGKMTKTRSFEQGDHRNYNRDGAAFHVGETFNGIPYELGVDLAEQAKTILPEGMDLVDVALRWILDHPQISSVIAGTTKAEQVMRNTQASALPPLSVELHQALAEFYKLHVRQHIRGGI
ncbi:aldo/keto reductase [Marinomonas mediterranea]|jgi:Predicted oxidoreductases (related to aryl-alcohol dehydrogenases)|uniref:NADP-dependent oxidoreductase domain n=1 Tax=Marinomonas mediterranea (strain ATCC 700492 / JCM 21426 / NBRC 103028 / MMB-1) TaxID=717774 RepID=F2JTS9_MARM1|nr:aldo/keto reductase [Marinomonas mediterranea]ADZ92699.1 NADP-dependent oxidoreductase domain [Marinomonas mediterranea MMB-1]WCN10634.1 aldo/keto reductase [Marinomonas mediterranea]WCN14691.1 aldo/keto reductase [Marinomonas mediterranea]WCN18730.1 aldo/keto reductase [Marinomonas mediterranea MMB-1]